MELHGTGRWAATCFAGWGCDSNAHHVCVEGKGLGVCDVVVVCHIDAVFFFWKDFDGLLDVVKPDIQALVYNAVPAFVLENFFDSAGGPFGKKRLSFYASLAASKLKIRLAKKDKVVANRFSQEDISGFTVRRRQGGDKCQKEIAVFLLLDHGFAYQPSPVLFLWMPENGAGHRRPIADCDRPGFGQSHLVGKLLPVVFSGLKHLLDGHFLPRDQQVNVEILVFAGMGESDDFLAFGKFEKLPVGQIPEWRSLWRF